MISGTPEDYWIKELTKAQRKTKYEEYKYANVLSGDRDIHDLFIMKLKNYPLKIRGTMHNCILYGDIWRFKDLVLDLVLVRRLGFWKRLSLSARAFFQILFSSNETK